LDQANSDTRITFSFFFFFFFEFEIYILDIRQLTVGCCFVHYFPYVVCVFSVSFHLVYIVYLVCLVSCLQFKASPRKALARRLGTLKTEHVQI
jgi:hypothetical protein